MTSILAIAIVAALTPVTENVSRERFPDGSVYIRLERGQNYQATDGAVHRRNTALVPSSDMAWTHQMAASDWMLYCATDEFRFRAETPTRTEGFEYTLSDMGLHWYDDSTGSDTFVSLGWPINDVSPTIADNIWTQEIFDGVRYTALAGAAELKTNIVWSASAISSIPSPTSVIASTAQAIDTYVSLILDVHDWSGLDVVADGEDVLDGDIWSGDAIEFQESGVKLFEFQPTHAYRDPEVSDLGDSFQNAVQESGIWYYVDRLNDRLYVDAPYNLFVGAATVVVDPPTYFSTGQGSSEGESCVFRNDDTDYQDGAYSPGISFYDYGGTSIWSLFKFEELADGTLPSNVDVSDASLVLKESSSSTPSHLGIASIAMTNPWESTGGVAHPPATGQNYPTWSHYNYDVDAWPTALSAGTDPSNGSVLGTWVRSFTPASTVTFEDDDQLAVAVEQMIGGTKANGFICWSTGTSSSWRSYGFNAANSSDRPQLNLWYSQILSPSSVVSASFDLDLAEAVQSDALQFEYVLPASGALSSNETITAPTLSFAAIESATVTSVTPNVSQTLIHNVTVFRWVGSFDPSEDSYVLSVSHAEEVTLRLYAVRQDGAGGSSGSMLTRFDRLDTLHEQTHIMVASVSVSVNDATSLIWGAVNDGTESVDGYVDDATLALQADHAALLASVGSVGATVEIIYATATEESGYVVISKGYYNTNTGLTNGEYQRDVPAGALSHVEQRWLTPTDVSSENWEGYQKRAYVIYSYPDAQAGSVYASHLIKSETPPVERLWDIKGADLW